MPFFPERQEIPRTLIERKLGIPSNRYFDGRPKLAAREPPMFQVRIHGRGGQGVVTGAEMLSVAAFFENRHAQAFPSFGSERMGAPVVAFCRIADKEIRLREPVLDPDCLIVQDPTLFKVIDVFAGLRTDGYLLVNTNKTLAELQIGQVVERLPKC